MAQEKSFGDRKQNHAQSVRLTTMTVNTRSNNHWRGEREVGTLLCCWWENQEEATTNRFGPSEH